jgi:hypothetical protein
MVDGQKLYRVRWFRFSEQDDNWEPLSSFDESSFSWKYLVSTVIDHNTWRVSNGYDS